jgi:hypothetical protein
MARVQWDTDGTRFFETGIDRGMLYVPFLPGVAWNGLVGVSENPSGGEVSEYFIDGQKYLAAAQLEEYMATIEAFGYPTEFAACMGLLRMSPGMYADDQLSQPFGFSYRTLIGNDLQGIDAGYKTHVVYNVQAKIRGFTNQSNDLRSEIKPYSWTITSVPEVIASFKPTAHYIFDSTKIDPVVITEVENILYGTEIDDPRLLLAEELLIVMGQ